MIAVRTAVLIAAAMTAAPAFAGDYPFTGDFTIAGSSDKADPLDTRRCALNFFRQGRDGGFTGYHVDLVKFLATREVDYVVYQRGTCAFDAKAKIESCNMAFDTDKDSQGSVYVDVLETVGAGYVRILSFGDLPQAEDYVSKGTRNDSLPISYFRCGFDMVKLNAALTDRLSTLPVPVRDELTLPVEELLLQPDIAELAKVMGLEK